MLKKRLVVIAGAVLLAFLIATPLLAATQARSPAQAGDTPSGDPAADTTRATIDLSAGFALDPYLLPVAGTGKTAAADVLKACNGFIADEPNVVVNWTGQAEQLSFFGYSDSDPVLVVEQPDGSIVCNDDAGLNTVDPLVTIANPAEGAYKIYVGSAQQDQPALGFLGMTALPMDDATLADLDLRPMLTRRTRPMAQSLPPLDLAALLTSRPALFGSATLKAGFAPVNTFAAGGGRIPAFSFADGQLVCAGYISPVPSYTFTWQGDPEAVRLFFETRADSTLAVITPDQQVLCNMNASKDNLNPVLDIAAPREGVYKVYIASMESGDVLAGRLTITGDTKATPSIRPPASQ